MLPSAPYGRAIAIGTGVALLATVASVLYTGTVFLAIDALFVLALGCCVVGAILTRPTVSRRKRIAESPPGTRRGADGGPAGDPTDGEEHAVADPGETNEVTDPDEATAPVPSTDRFGTRGNRSGTRGDPVGQFRFGIGAVVVAFTLFAWSIGLHVFVA